MQKEKRRRRGIKMKCRACGVRIIIFSDGWTPHVLEIPSYGYTEYHRCKALGINAKMLPKSVCKQFGIEPEE